jgi:hypothetical protein
VDLQTPVAKHAHLVHDLLQEVAPFDVVELVEAPPRLGTESLEGLYSVRTGMMGNLLLGGP